MSLVVANTPSDRSFTEAARTGTCAQVRALMRMASQDQINSALFVVSGMGESRRNMVALLAKKASQKTIGVAHETAAAQGALRVVQDLETFITDPNDLHRVRQRSLVVSAMSVKDTRKVFAHLLPHADQTALLDAGRSCSGSVVPGHADYLRRVIDAFTPSTHPWRDTNPQSGQMVVELCRRPDRIPQFQEHLAALWAKVDPAAALTACLDTTRNSADALARVVAATENMWTDEQMERMSTQCSAKIRNVVPALKAFREARVLAEHIGGTDARAPGRMKM